MIYQKSVQFYSVVTLALGLWAPSLAGAQRIEVSPFVGYTTAGTLDRTSRQVSELEIESSFTWGGQFDYFFGESFGIGASYSQQQTGFGITTVSGGSATLFDLTASQLHGNFTYQFGGGDSSVRPYLLAGIGATFFRSENLQSETKLSFGVGGGVKAFISKSIGFKVQGKFNPTRLGDDSSGDFCDPFGFCQGTLSQFELGGGVVFRF